MNTLDLSNSMGDIFGLVVYGESQKYYGRQFQIPQILIQQLLYPATTFQALILYVDHLQLTISVTLEIVSDYITDKLPYPRH